MTACDVCRGPNGIFILNGQNLCRHCHPPFDEETRTALNALMDAGLIYPKK